MRISLITLLGVLLIAPLPGCKDVDGNAADRSAHSSADQAQWDKHVTQWQERMDQMHQQMEEISRTTDSETRGKLLEEHWKLMDEQMLATRMIGGGMMQHRHQGRRDGWHHMMNDEARDQYMYDRIDMLQMMMEQLMYHQHMMMRDARSDR